MSTNKPKPNAKTPAKSKGAHPHLAAVRALRAFGLAYPGAHKKSPWPDHLDLAVKDKTFAYLTLDGEPLGISCKLPYSANVALTLPFAKPTEYGLGKSGWVSASFEESEQPPVELLKRWIDESYRAQAPKKLVASLDAADQAQAPSPTRTKPKPAKKATTPAKAKSKRRS